MFSLTSLEESFVTWFNLEAVFLEMVLGTMSIAVGLKEHESPVFNSFVEDVTAFAKDMSGVSKALSILAARARLRTDLGVAAIEADARGAFCEITGLFGVIVGICCLFAFTEEEDMLCERRILRRVIGDAVEMSLLVIFIDFGVDPLAGTSANRLATISMYLSAFVAAVRRVRPSVKGVSEGGKVFMGCGVAVSIKVATLTFGDFSFSGVLKRWLDLRLFYK
jgi:hypothetical protein